MREIGLREKQISRLTIIFKKTDFKNFTACDLHRDHSPLWELKSAIILLVSYFYRRSNQFRHGFLNIKVEREKDCVLIKKSLEYGDLCFPVSELVNSNNFESFFPKIIF